MCVLRARFQMEFEPQSLNGANETPPARRRLSPVPPPRDYARSELYPVAAKPLPVAISPPSTAASPLVETMPAESQSPDDDDNDDGGVAALSTSLEPPQVSQLFGWMHAIVLFGCPENPIHRCSLKQADYCLLAADAAILVRMNRTMLLK